jgi:hypothetical protein
LFFFASPKKNQKIPIAIGTAIDYILPPKGGTGNSYVDHLYYCDLSFISLFFNSMQLARASKEIHRRILPYSIFNIQ